MGIETIAVYSDIDRHSRHVEMCDKAYHIGPSPACKTQSVAFVWVVD